MNNVRKQSPVTTGFLDYFPLAVMEIARCSAVGNEQHNPGAALHWDRAKSGDEADALVRHLMERGTMDSDGIRHTTKAAWRAMALLQKELEAVQPEASAASSVAPFTAIMVEYSRRPLDKSGNVI